MEPNEQPDEVSDRTITIRLSRENMILAAAVLFLTIAVLLAIFFPLGSPGDPGNSSATSVAVGGTPGGDRTTAVASRPTANGATATTDPGAGQATPTIGAYPDPQAAATAFGFPVATPSDGQGSPNQPANVGATPSVFDPEASPTTPGFELEASPTTSGDSSRGTAGATTSAQAPTFAPSRPTATTAGNTGSYPAPGTTTQPTANTNNPSPTSDVLIVPTNTPAAPVVQPTPRPPRPTQQPAVQPTSGPAGGSGDPSQPAPTRRPAATATPVPPTPVPIDVINGSMRWSASQGPITIRRDLQIAAGSQLVIEPGVEVRLAPGVAVYVDGTLYAAGQPGNPVRFVSTQPGQRWDGLYGRPGSDIGMDQVEIRGGGNGGTLISSEGGNLTVRNARVTDNGGNIQARDSRLEMRGNEISGNDMPYGAAIDASYSSGGGVTLTNNRIGGNRLEAGAPPVQIRNQSTLDTVNLDIQGNLMVGEQGPDMVVQTDGPLSGGLTCNTWINGTEGLMVKASTLQIANVALNIRDNAIENHTPPIIPIYLEYGIGRGASSDIYIDMTNNWWRSETGPYHPDLHADGRGEAAGNNITFAPWLTARPACAPTP